jgi:hypothetical protein
MPRHNLFAPPKPDIPIPIIVILPEFADRQFCVPYRKLPMSPFWSSLRDVELHQRVERAFEAGNHFERPVDYFPRSQ